MKRIRESDTSDSEPSDHEMVPLASSEITCDGTFQFFKVGKTCPSLEFTTILQFDKNILLHDLRADLIKQHMVGIDIFKKLP